jgi:hypothetical protein
MVERPAMGRKLFSLFFYFQTNARWPRFLWDLERKKMSTDVPTLFVSYFGELLDVEVWKRADLTAYHTHLTQSVTTRISRTEAAKQLAMLSPTVLRSLCPSNLMYALLQSRVYIDKLQHLLVNILRDEEDYVEFMTLWATQEETSILRLWYGTQPSIADYTELRAFRFQETKDQLAVDMDTVKIMSTVIMSVVLLLLVAVTIRWSYRRRGYGGYLPHSKQT